jgi:hypothetical protein
VSEVSALGLNQLGKAFIEKVAFASVSRNAAQRQSRLASNRWRDAMLEIGGLMSGKEQPRSCAHALRKEDVGPAELNRRDMLYVRHARLSGFCERRRSGVRMLDERGSYFGSLD